MNSSDDYYGQNRLDLLSLLPADRHFHKVLEIGCGEGRSGSALLQAKRADWITGVEVVPEIAIRAREQLSEVLCLSIETDALPFKNHEFDLILLADVLEHLVDPWATMQRVASWLEPGGLVLCSIPNIRHWRGVWAVLSGRWIYRDQGLFDKTHLRFFSRQSALDLISCNGLSIEAVARKIVGKSKIINMITLGLLADFCVRQFYFLAHKE